MDVQSNTQLFAIYHHVVESASAFSRRVLYIQYCRYCRRPSHYFLLLSWSIGGRRIESVGVIVSVLVLVSCWLSIVGNSCMFKSYSSLRVPASQYVEVIGHLHEDHTVQEFKTTDMGDSFGEMTKPRLKPGVFRSSDLMKPAVLPCDIAGMIW